MKNYILRMIKNPIAFIILLSLLFLNNRGFAFTVNLYSSNSLRVRSVVERVYHDPLDDLADEEPFDVILSDLDETAAESGSAYIEERTKGLIREFVKLGGEFGVLSMRHRANINRRIYRDDIINGLSPEEEQRLNVYDYGGVNEPEIQRLVASRLDIISEPYLLKVVRGVWPPAREVPLGKEVLSDDPSNPDHKVYQFGVLSLYVPKKGVAPIAIFSFRLAKDGGQITQEEIDVRLPKLQQELNEKFPKEKCSLTIAGEASIDVVLAGKGDLVRERYLNNLRYQGCRLVVFDDDGRKDSNGFAVLSLQHPRLTTVLVDRKKDSVQLPPHVIRAGRQKNEALNHLLEIEIAKRKLATLERVLKDPSPYVQWKALSWFAGIDAASLSSENLRRATEMLVNWKKARAEIKRGRDELLDRIFNIYHHRGFGVFSKIEGPPISFEAEMKMSADYARDYPQRRTQVVEVDRRKNPWLVDGLKWPAGKGYKPDLDADVRLAFTALSYYNAFPAHGMQGSIEGFMNVILEGNIRGYPFDDFGNLIEENRVATGRFDSFDYNRGTEDNPLGYGPGIVVLAKRDDYRDHIAYLVPSKEVKEVIVEGLREAKDKGIIDEAGYSLRCAKLKTYGEYADWYVQNVNRVLEARPDIRISDDMTFVSIEKKLKGIAIMKNGLNPRLVPITELIKESGGMDEFLKIIKDAVRWGHAEDPDRPYRSISDEEMIGYLHQQDLTWAKITEDASDIRQARVALRKIDALPPGISITDALIKKFTFNWEGDTFYIIKDILESRSRQLQ